MKFLKRSLLVLLGAAMLVFAAAFAAGCSDKVTLSFDSQGGSAVETMTATPGEEIVLPEPEKEGFAFLGWYESGSSAEGTLRGKITAPDKNTKYVASWTEGVLLTLDPAGGSLGKTRTFVAEGAVLSEEISSLVPEKADAEFGNWFYEDGKELGARDKMPATPLTLKAKYKVAYTVRVYLQTLDGLGFDLSEENGSSGKGYEGETVSADGFSVFGFVLAENNAGMPDSVALAAGKRNNLDLYFERATMTLSFSANAPDGTVHAPVAKTAIFGAEVATPESAGVTVKGYRFAGWSTSAAAPGDAAQYRPGEKMTASGNLTVYAVWDVGLVDRYGGDDFVFFPQFEPEKAVLVRAGIEFAGTREGDSFFFALPNGQRLEGKAFGAAFSFKRSGIEGTYTSYLPYNDPTVPESERLKAETLVIDEYYGAVYTERVEGSDVVLGGVVNLVDAAANEYSFLVTEGEYIGFGFLFRLRAEGGRKLFLQSQGEKGSYDEFTRINSGAYGQNANGAFVELDGFGGIVYSDNDTVMYGVGEYYVESVIENLETGSTFFVVHATVRDTDYSGNPTGEPFELEFYTTYLSDVDYYAYVRRTAEEGTYVGKVNGADATLKLDGLEIFPESAVCTVGTEEYASSYFVTRSVLGEVTVTMAFLTNENVHTFKLNGNAFEEVFPDENEWTDYYRLMEGDLYTPLLRVYREAAENAPTGALKAELYVERNRRNVLIERGYVSSEVLGGPSATRKVTLYSFRQTEVVDKQFAETDLVYSMTFLVRNVSNGTNTVDVYYPFTISYGTGNSAEQKLYREYTGEDGATFRVIDVVFGLGSLYFAPNGDVYDGSLSIEENFWGTPVGTFASINDVIQNYDYLYFEFTLDANGVPTGFRSLDEPPAETALFAVRSGVMDNQEATMILYGDVVHGAGGNMIYAPDGNWETGERGTWSVAGTNVFGDRILAFIRDDAVRFYFVWDKILYDDVGQTVEVYRYWMRENNGAAVGSFVATYVDETLGTLSLDGFEHAASYTANGVYREGSYYLGEGRNSVYFTATDGKEFIFDLGEDFGRTGFSLLDAAYGYYEIEINRVAYSLYFNGRGNFYLLDASKQPVPDQANGYYGRYLIAEGDGTECICVMLRGDVDGRQSFTVSLDGRTLSFRNDSSYGVFLDETWNVLLLDGYGRGTLYTADDGTGREGDLFVIDDDLDGKGRESFAFLRLGGEDERFFRFTLPAKSGGTGTFVLERYDEAYYYYNDDFSDGITFRTDGFSYVGNRSGYYFFDEDGAHVYLLNAELGSLYLPVDLPLPGNDSIAAPYRYSYTSENTGREIVVSNQTEYGGNGKTTYYRYDPNEKIRIDGTIRFDDGTPAVEASIEFALDGETNLYLDATFSWKEGTSERKEAIVFSNRRVTSVEDGTLVWAPVVFFDASFSLFEEFLYLPGGADNGFVGLGGTVESTLYEDFDHNPDNGSDVYSTLTTYYRGYGPIALSEPKMKGELYYLPDEETGKVSRKDECLVRFDGVDPDTVKEAGTSSTYGTRYLLDFTDEKGVRYGLFYYKDGSFFVLYVFTTYSSVETADGYEVGVGNFVYSNSYTLVSQPERGDACIFLLYDKEGELVETEFGSGVGYGGTSAWIVDVVPEYDPATSARTAGHGYGLEFTYEGDALASATVREYEFRQAVSESNPVTGVLLDFFIDEEGNERLVSVQVYDAEDSAYFFYQVISVEVGEDGVWTVEAGDGFTYAFRFVAERDGDRMVYAGDHVSWVFAFAADPVETPPADSSEDGPESSAETQP